MAARRPTLVRADFNVRYPEFARVSRDAAANTELAALIDAKLAEAALSIDADVWGDNALNGGYALAAHLLAISPFGMNARLASSSGDSTYNQTYLRLQRQIGPSARVL